MRMNEQVSSPRVAERLLTRPAGATMAEIIAATGGSQYNLLRVLEARGYQIRRRKEGRLTRYFATPPVVRSYAATVTSKGQVTIPKEVRESLRIRSGQTVRFVIDEGERASITPEPARLADLAGALGKPPRSVTPHEIEEAIRRGAVARFRRTSRGK
jgi:AbrB family looped-hinge helix DNA binding protein